jgi:hypothetical protein
VEVRERENIYVLGGNAGGVHDIEEFAAVAGTE